MLKPCPECEMQVSDKATVCPHCGFPLHSSPVGTVHKSRRRHARLPNGFGQITELRGRNLRKPFRVMVTAGVTPEGKPIVKLLQPVAYFKTYNDAYKALMEYNKCPYDLTQILTMQELYERWIDEYTKKVCNGNIISTNSAWKYANDLYDMPVRTVRISHIKNTLLNGTFVDRRGITHHTTHHIQLTLKKIFNQMFDYAVEYEMTDKNYARMFNLPEPSAEEKATEKYPHFSFSDRELEILWGAAGTNIYIDIILIQCYSGWRASELIKLELSKVNLEEQTFRGGSKTNAGKDRIVPIHHLIYPLVEKRYREAKRLNSPRLFNIQTFVEGDFSFIYYELYARQFKVIINRLALDPRHHTHDCRKTFVTMAKRANVDEYAIKRIIGHQIADLTERVYTDRSIDWLRSEIEKIH